MFAEKEKAPVKVRRKFMPLHPMVTWKDDSIVRDRRGNVKITPEVIADVLSCVGNGLSIDRALVKGTVLTAPF